MRTRTRALRVLVACFVAILLSLPAAAIGQDLDSVKQHKDELEQEIDEVTADLDRLHARISQTRDQLDTLKQRNRQLEKQASSARQALQQRARQSFIGGDANMSTFESLLSSDGPTAALERASMLEALSRRDVTSLEQATALRVQIEQNRALLQAKSGELDELKEELEIRTAELQDNFKRVSEQYADLKARKDRQQQISNGAQQGTYACIFEGAYHFRDTWGAPRSGGRGHKGTDVMAPYGAPVYAFTNGRISRISNSGLGGLGLYIYGDDGVEYYYAHLADTADSYAGQRVEAGQLVAHNGSSGNADRWAPHVHFEVHPGGGGAVNPYHWLTPVC